MEGSGKEMQKLEKVYYARCLGRVDIFELLELTVRTVEDTWFSAIDAKTSQAFCFDKEDLGHVVFKERNDALQKVKELEEKLRKENLPFSVVPQ